jgi:hypothetical protein
LSGLLSDVGFATVSVTRDGFDLWAIAEKPL